ncbi:methyltransferase domain-containing protein [Thiosulfativibrio zosterae]|uniref:tRNA 5-carboxymethoxyuridine methyltransferase n=1 Tax=Thiosulfativibrio zosterae TaxID=2675053 RepID=A0A6F8PJT2_9GAMM|nr:methyltransferase domain-containing protein [Thiosulfativibrio zosterae]BBP42355.1 tRNA 5-carboxymethoxyuridine methyltransferase [Thiosulfativibrio zosterae]
MQQDRNFDKLIHKFEKRVYDTRKGDWRLKLLKEDLAELHTQPPLQIWDAGCGFGQMGLWFAQAGHQLTLCDLSHKMLERAQQHFAQAYCPAQFLQGAAQDLAPQLDAFDLILSHAVLEWLAQPKESLQALADKVKPKGYLSLLYYNRNATVYTNVLKGDWRLEHILNDSYLGKGKNLTPPNPQYPEDVLAWLQDWDFEVQVETGIRVFHDYMTPEALAKTDMDELFALEYRYCRQPTYRHMGRYIHVLARKRETCHD